jgi:radical SAM superfamily enzyme YgiQ (UPF0313 family)
MKILFIYTREFPQSPVKPLVDFEAIQFGISYISSYLKQYGHQTMLLVLTRESNFIIIDKFMTEFDPRLICFTAVASEYAFVNKIGSYIKYGFPDKFLMLGGVHASLRPEEAMRETFDACCIGEGEEATLELVSQLEQGRYPSGIASLWIKKNDGFEKNPTRLFISDLDTIPNADRGMWMEWIDMERSPQRPSLLLGRGCPFICTYCCNHSLKKLAPGKYVRFRSAENVIGEIRELINHMPKMREIYFEVETLGANIDWALELCSKLYELNTTLEQPLSFGVNFRITHNLKKMGELFIALKNSNFRFVNIGLESGSERIRHDVLKRDYSNEDVVKAVILAKKHNLEVTFYNLIGLPSETIEDFKETIRINRICLPEGNSLSIFHPYPGTDLYNLCNEQGLLPPSLTATVKERVFAALDFPDFKKKQIQKAFIWFDYYVYKDHKPDSVLFDQILTKYILAYRGTKIILMPYILVRDLISPSLKFFPTCREYLIITRVLFIILRIFVRKLFSLRNALLSILENLIPKFQNNVRNKW